MTSTKPAAFSRRGSPSGNGIENGEGRGKDEWKGHSKRLCSDWLVSYESNFSVAKDREWFTTYTPFDSYVLDHKGVLMEVYGIGRVTLPVECSDRSDDNPTQGAEIILQDVLHVPKAVCNLVSRHDSALGRQELWTLPSEKDPYKRGVFQHQHRNGSKSNEPGPGLGGGVDVCVYMLPNSGSLCLLDLDMDRPPTGYALAHTSFPVYTDRNGNGSPKMLMDTYSGDLIPLTWPDNQRERWKRKKETGDDNCSRTIATNTGPRIQNSELVKRLMDQRAGLISQLGSLDMLIDDLLQGVTPAAAASVNNNADTTRPITTTGSTSMASSPSIVTPAATASVDNSETTPTPADTSTTPSIPGAAVDHSGVCCHGEEEDNTQATEELVRTAIEEEAKAEEDAQWETQSEEELGTMVADDKFSEWYEEVKDQIMAEYDDIEDEVMAEYEDETEDEDDGGVTGQEEIAASSDSEAGKAYSPNWVPFSSNGLKVAAKSDSAAGKANSPNWVPLSNIGLKVECNSISGRYTGHVIVTLPGGCKTKTWSYDKVKKKKLSEEDKAWFRAMSKYTPHFFKSIGYNADTDTWEPERGGPEDRAHARTLLKWLRYHARPPLSHGGEIRIDLDAGVLDDHGLKAAKERLRVLRAAGRDPSPEARQELNFIHETTLRLRSELNMSYKDAPDARIWSYNEIFGKY
ncbi:hypothetical protein NEUTE1DRAFT_66775 [Neurospora tetrasperma FGSC 2508]|uniref:Retrovirus-related Pol polyprotein from transposon TNT 1-94-like beta-barrel domain-containing protein n=1 Tax=Neurospora tetrasperma (strain FGSC 2508 / ATCC MYA-4615 / P0657) TaxID=510951 RepID=F8MTF7_NEUT8|nr:uncharacterized protein NEUTE1DRAFT_66775 [Neurospora tetrasperma FGSC 2508]EGO55289.1 hypothetical protein NEUTE1DRAFT_66775 [Neurospora tetrasperma FGSC 2508]EGZ69489.1 hypothetical protein NEUTE2DRAFT_94720 [Neurospora tetrasperma FGSC 2509]